MENKKLPTIEDMRTIKMPSYLADLEQSGVNHIDRDLTHFYPSTSRVLQAQAEGSQFIGFGHDR